MIRASFLIIAFILYVCSCFIFSSFWDAIGTLEFPKSAIIVTVFVQIMLTIGSSASIWIIATYGRRAELELKNLSVKEINRKLNFENTAAASSTVFLLVVGILIAIVSAA